MRTFVDANVLLEVLLHLRPKRAQAEKALKQADAATISPLVAHLYVYFGQKEGHPLKDLLEDLESYFMVPLTAQHVSWARINHQDQDFEDALQVGCALTEGCDTFLTLDARLAKNYSQFINFIHIT
jgi:predicted nucleic acid-binding protein